jgi:NAD(P)-dependent dehydrogenase (short-subunit alcohol dehydrogenase family)
LFSETEFSSIKETDMTQFEGRIAVVTGGGTGMGRELVCQLAATGCHVAMCDVSQEAMRETATLSRAKAPEGTIISSFVADVSSPSDLAAFRDAVISTHTTDHINLLFNNAGIGGGGSLVVDTAEEWDKVFGICWGGVYHSTRTFLPLLLKSAEGHVINTSSVNGFWACLGSLGAHTAYSAAKFAVKGFTEALVVDFRLNAPHLKASVVMPGHIGTSIVFNSGQAFGRNPKELNTAHVTQIRERLASQGIDAGNASDEDIRALAVQRAESFRDDAPTSAAEAASIILDGVRNDRWRILVGDDAFVVDELVRLNPVDAYEPSFTDGLTARGVFGFIPKR